MFTYHISQKIAVMKEQVSKFQMFVSDIEQMFQWEIYSIQFFGEEIFSLYSMIDL